jgi:transposase
MQCMDRTSLEDFLNQGLSLAEIGRRFDRHEETVAYWVRKHGLEAVNRQKHTARGGLSREQLEPLVEQGASIAEIAEAVDRSKATVRHWLKEYELKTRRATLRQSVEQTRRSETNDDDIVVRECRLHGVTQFKRRSPSGYRCLKCRSDAVTERRRRVKQILVQEAGGECSVCGYRRCVAALEFHHLDRATKRFSLSHRGVARSIEKARVEAKKCVLLCANCHAEVEAGIVVASARRTPA